MYKNDGGKFWLYRATDLRTYLEDVYDNPDKALSSAKSLSNNHPNDVLSVFNSNGVCIGKFCQGIFYI